MRNIIPVFISCLIICISCKKESFNTSPDAGLLITADTIKFDTVFTTNRSINKSFKIINTNDQKIMISSIHLGGSANSPFHLNINGTAANEAENIEIASNDSIYVFVTVTVNPTTDHLPFIVNDSISILFNGNTENVQLLAYGQNARFLVNTTIAGNVTWDNTFPYVIEGSLRIDTTAILNINAGTKVYVHGTAPFLVDGTLIINGNINAPVIFRSDRLDDYYKDIPGGWPGIYIRGSSTNNKFTYAYLKNAFQAIKVSGPSLNSNPQLEIHQCIIDNAADGGIIALNTTVNADNTLISNCASNLKIGGGGIYNFTNSTLASYSTNFIFHQKPVSEISNTAFINNIQTTNPLNAIFTNCIFWGDNGSPESEMDVIREGSLPFTLILDHCLYKGVSDPPEATLLSVIRNEDPVFDSIDVSDSYYDFRVNNHTSPVINQGIMTSYLNDLDNHLRTGIPDLGCYEKP